MKKLLLPVSFAYAAAVKIDRALTAQRHLSKPVISVGNITWGGTGKTPVVIALARYFSAHNRTVAVLSRGYKRKSSKTLVVSDGAGSMASPEQAGDEPYLIARQCPQAVVMAGTDRFAAGSEALSKFPVDSYILDDGFQHWRLARDLDIVCINAADPFGNGCLIPAGSLRESPAALRRAGIILLTNADRVDEVRRTQILREIQRNTDAPVCLTTYVLDGVRRIIDGTALPADRYREQPVTVVSALGNNTGFVQSVADAGCVIADCKAFRDHHWYTADELKKMQSRDNGIFITTAKDAVKLKSLLCSFSQTDGPDSFAGRWYELGHTLSFIEGENLWQEKIKPFL
ncbi:MAG: tetraacyldisaccharide 4'-kinase [Elusimicrobia bacterium]|nr:tetraacyldisaccharide 4'-kinase [Elusimicrobiota bacterium]